MWRTNDEDLYRRVFEAAHDDRVSMNAWITATLDAAAPARVARPDTSVEDKANARASLTHATESRDA
jgi:hypothetical protein